MGVAENVELVRVRYDDDAALVALGGLTMAPFAMWSSDRSRNPRLRRPATNATTDDKERAP